MNFLVLNFIEIEYEILNNNFTSLYSNYTMSVLFAGGLLALLSTGSQ